MVLRRAIFTQALCIASFIFLACHMSLAKSVKKRKSDSLTEASQGDETSCYNFTVGNMAKKEFYSPNYPNFYPKNIKCTRTITADVGHTVMLDFRDQFWIENSSGCEYDKLEVRDGAYSYSTRLGLFCGRKFPKKLFSTKRHMWLQFISDESIEYSGFRAVYEFIPMPNRGNREDGEKECSFHRSGPSGVIQKSEIDHIAHKYNADETIECMWTIVTDPGKKLYLNFDHYKLERPNDCEQNFIEIFEGVQTPDKSLIKFCGTTAEPQKSTSNITFVRLQTNKQTFPGTNFTLHYTSFREISKEAREVCDPATEFNCYDQTCVDIALKCDGHSDCKYQYDEDPKICATALGAGMVLTSEHMIIILVVFFALVIAMCASISISCYNKIKERQVREREYKERRSKEASVEANVDRNLRGHSSPDRALEAIAKSTQQTHTPPFRDDADDEESSDGCYVPEVDLSGFKHPNGGQTIPKKPRGLQQQQQFPYISESFESLQSDVIVPPAPPPVPKHMKERRDLSPPPPTYRIVGGKVVANPSKNEPAIERMQQELGRPALDSKGGRYAPSDSRPGSAKPTTGYSGYKPVDKSETPIRTLDREPTGPMDPKSNFLRGPLEAGAPRSAFSRTAGEIGLPKFGMARVTPDGPRGPLAGKGTGGLSSDKGMPMATFRSPYEDTSRGYRPGTARNYPARNTPDTDTLRTIDASDKESSRAHSVASTLSAPDVIGKR